MSKQIQKDEEIYLASKILGKYEDSIPVAIDEKNNNKKLDPRDIDDKITIYEREVNEWFLNPATKLLKQDSSNNSFVVLMICMSYLEGVEQYKTGVGSNGRCAECFSDSVMRIYPNKNFDARKLKKLYDKSRCGLFHNGMVKSGVVLNNTFEEPIGFLNNGETIKVNPKIFLNDLKNDFTEYINKLRNDQLRVLREDFNRMFSVL